MVNLEPSSEALRSARHSPKQEDPKRELLTIAEACDYLRVSRHSIYRLINERKLPSVPILSRRMIQLADIKAYIAAQLEGAA